MVVILFLFITGIVCSVALVDLCVLVVAVYVLCCRCLFCCVGVSLDDRVFSCVR